ncbi:MAG: cupin domain-containing protein [Bacillota bacterium]|nr:cupin domain-containing protein [Bacillota bacterium]
MSEAQAQVDSPTRIVEKPWGREIWWAQTDRYVGKIIEVKAGGSLSLQYHERKMESMYFVEGSGTLLLGEREIPIRPGLHVTIPPLTRHRVTATADVRFFEVSTPEVEDVVRLEDAYGRAGRSA